MSLEPNKDWRPSASLQTLQLRAHLLQFIRSFFNERGLFEVDVPVLCQATVSDAYLASFTCEGNTRFLQTSPEYAMKRIVAAYKIPIYYLGKAFRQGEHGAKHNPEFTMLEWYRPGWDHHQLIEEINELFQAFFNCGILEITTYQNVFQKYLNVCPFEGTEAELRRIARDKNWVDHHFNCDKNGWLDLLMTHGIEPFLGQKAPMVILDYPAFQGSLAKLRKNALGFEVAERFEIYYRGMELANGYHELTCPIEQRKRFEKDNCQRQQLGLPEIPIDEFLIGALQAGLVDSAGVAIGFDRLLMLKLNASKISEVLPFEWECA